jgi:hypothetical protein
VSLVHALLVFLHVLAIAAWMAAAMWIAGDVKRTLGLGRPYVDVLPARIKPALGLDAVAGIASIVTGVLLMIQEHIGRPRIGLTLGIVFALGRLGVLAAVRGAWRDLATRIAAGSAPPADDPAARRLAMLSGIAHTLWLLALAGMVLPV